MQYKYFLYSKGKILLRVQAKKMPSIKTMPKSGTWVVYELHNNEWLMPCFPEIVWETLRNFTYLGELKNTDE